MAEEDEIIPQAAGSGGSIIPINIEDEMKTAYIDYSMSVIVSRAIPDVRDGFKPVHRRVLFGMNELGVASNKPHKKSARIVGEILGKFHPHGDKSVYDTMVRMAQPWSLRYLLVDGQGNFGSVDGDEPAAMRYTEARFQKIAEEMLEDIDKDTVDMQLNFDDTLKEPTVLPTRIPNLLINGSSGIAVGMATNILPHNLTEVIDGIMAYIENHDITITELMEFIKAPDFPTGGTIYGYEGVRQAFETGRGRVVVRAVAEIEEYQNHERIIISQIPYQVNKSNLIARAAELVNEGKIEGITDIRDESDRQGMRIVIELRRDANASVVLNMLYKNTALQTSFGVNNIALVGGRPKLLNLKDMIQHFVEFRHEVIVRRTQFELKEAEKRAHILEGLMIAIDNLDAVIKLIRAADTVEVAREGLITQFDLSDIQARAILDLRLQKLTGLELTKLKQEYEEVMARIAYLKSLLEEGNLHLRMGIIKEELQEVKRKYGDERRTDIIYSGEDIDIEDLISNEKVVVTISHLGYIKRTNSSEFRSQGRGGRGSRGGATREEDFIEYIFSADMHNYILFFTEQGKCFWLKVYELPEGTKTSKGRAIQNIINIDKEDKVKAFINVYDLKSEEALKSQYIVLCTKKGIIKKTTLEAYSRPRTNGIIALTVREGDTLLEAKLTDGTSDIMMAVRSGKCIRFNEEKEVRAMGRGASGVTGMRFDDENDEIIGMITLTQAQLKHAEETNKQLAAFYAANGDDAELTPELAEALRTMQTILVVSEKGYGKRSDFEEYRFTKRGAKGVKTISITEKTGNLISIKDVSNEDDLMIINKSGITIRMGVDELRVMGRATQGVRLIKLDAKDAIAAVTKIQALPEEELTEEGEATEGTEPTGEQPTGEQPTSEAEGTEPETEE